MAPLMEVYTISLKKRLVLVEQLKNGVRALRAPVNTLESNWAYMVIAALAWNLKAWLALLQPRSGHRQQLLTMEFRKFLDEVVLLPVPAEG
jgi:hypothetical protein